VELVIVSEKNCRKGGGPVPVVTVFGRFWQERDLVREAFRFLFLLLLNFF
jgi:hypothetical protein